MSTLHPESSSSSYLFIHTHSLNIHAVHASRFSASFRYFEDDEEEAGSGVDLPYIPAENSPTRQQMQPGGGSDSEDDPLDAFMAEVEVRWRLTQRPNTLFVFFPPMVLTLG